MSTELKDIIGRVETFTEVGAHTGVGAFELSYEEQRLSLTRFWGGENGIMVQLTMPANDGPFAYIQLTKDQVKELIVELTKEIL